MLPSPVLRVTVDRKIQRRKRYLYSTDVMPSRTLRWIRSRNIRLSQAAGNASRSTEQSAGEPIVTDPLMAVCNDTGSNFNRGHTCHEAKDSELHLDSGSCQMDESFNLSSNSDVSSSEISGGSSNTDDFISEAIHHQETFEDEDSRKEDTERGGHSWKLPEQHELELGIPLSDTTDTTRGDALLICLAFGMRHSLSWKAMEDLLKTINFLFGKEVVKSSKYFFQKYMEAGTGKMTYHIYCPYCQRYLGSREEFLEANVGCPCGKKLKDISDASTFFISLSLGDQIKDLLRDQGFVEALQYRFKREKNSDDAYEDIYDGEVYKRLCGQGQILSYWSNMSYTFNTDGFPVGGKYGKQTCWPIYAQINELPPELRSKFMLLAGIYVGKRDPNMNIFLHPFVEEANVLSTTGIHWSLDGKEINSKIVPLCACVDTPARHKILNTTAFNGKFGCSLCYISPEPTVVGYRYPMPMQSLKERTHEEILSDAKKAHSNRTLIRNKKNRRVRGVKGPSPLHNLLYLDLVKSVRPDSMHSILLGNAKHFVSVLHGKPGKPFYIGSDVRMRAISDCLLSIRPPSSLMRVPREFIAFSSWQAKEWRSWLLFYCVPCLLNIVPVEYVNLINLLSSAVHIALRKSISLGDLEKMHTLLLRYVFLFQQYFGKEEMVVNIHLLLHLKRSIEYLGPAWTNVAFAFEGCNRNLLQLKKGASSIAQEIAGKYMTFRSIPLLCHKYASSERALHFIEDLSGRPLLKSYKRVGEVVLVGRGKNVKLNPEEMECLAKSMMVSHVDFLQHHRFIMSGVSYSVGSSGKTDDSFISVRGESKARIEKILECQEGPSIYLIVRKYILNDEAIFDDEFGQHSSILRLNGKGQLSLIKPEDISAQCVAMFLGSGDFICEVPYGCYRES